MNKFKSILLFFVTCVFSAPLSLMAGNGVAIAVRGLGSSVDGNVYIDPSILAKFGFHFQNERRIAFSHATPHAEAIQAVKSYFNLISRVHSAAQTGASRAVLRELVEKTLAECFYSRKITQAVFTLGSNPDALRYDQALRDSVIQIAFATHCAAVCLSDLKARNIVLRPSRDMPTFAQVWHLVIDPPTPLAELNRDFLKASYQLWPSWILAGVAQYFPSLKGFPFRTYVVGKTCMLRNFIQRPLEFGAFQCNRETIIEDGVEELDIRDAQLTSLDLTNIKKIFPNLKKINLSGNLIKHLSARDIALMEGLEVNLENNPITTIENHTNPPFGARITFSSVAPITKNAAAMAGLRTGNAWSRSFTAFVTTPILWGAALSAGYTALRAYFSDIPRDIKAFGGFMAAMIGGIALSKISEKRKPAQVIITGQADDGGMYVP